MACSRRCVAIATLMFLVKFGNAYPEPSKFLIASNAKTGAINYMVLPTTPDQWRSLADNGARMQDLIYPGELQAPQGLDVDYRRKRLLVADPKSKKVLAYPLNPSSDSLSVGSAVELADAEARWVATDGRGNVYFSDEAKNQILKIPTAGGKPEVMYDGGANKVSGPGGIGTDNFNVFWTNKVDGQSAGSLVMAPIATNSTDPNATQGAATVLSKNIAKSYGVCMSTDNIFYTADTKAVYGMKRTGGEPTRISNTFGNPRGCAWDGDSTMYVADRAAGGIFYFPAQLGAIHLTETEAYKVVDMPDAFGVAVFVNSCRRALSQALLGLLVLRVLM